MKTKLILAGCLALATVAVNAQNSSYDAPGPPFIGGTNSTAFGFQSLFNNTGANNAGSGFLSLFSNMNGSQNSAYGWLSMNNNTMGNNNTGIGAGALTTNINGDNNTGLGINADVGSNGLINATALGANAIVNSSDAVQLGDGNVTRIFAGVGTMATVFTGGLQVSGGSPAAGKVLTSDAAGNATWQTPSGGSGWSLVGNAGTTSSNFLGTTDGASLRFRVNNTVAGQVDPASPYNVTLGYRTHAALTTGYGNAFFGYESGRSVTTGAALVGAGYLALNNNTSGICNTALGSYAMYQTSTGIYNCATGYSTFRDNTTGSYNTAEGVGAMLISNGDQNTGIGYSSLSNNTTGNGNTALGSQSNVGSGGLTDAMALGLGAIVNASYKTRIGDANMGNTESQNGIFTTSDGRFKTNISEDDVKGMEFIKRLRPVVYNFDTKKFTEFLTKNMPDSLRKKYLDKDFSASTAMRKTGFIAQEVEKAAQEAGYNFSGVHTPESDNDNYSIGYDQIVVPLVKAVQEQQGMIEKQASDYQKQIVDLQQQLEEQKQMISELQRSSGSATGLNQLNDGSAGFKLEQNEPNPFSNETVIRYTLPEKVGSAYLAVYDLSGKQVTTFPITQKGSASITITSEKLAAGIYIYSVVADNKILDSRRMVVANK